MEANFLTCAAAMNGGACFLCPNKIPKELLHKQNAGNATTISLKVLFKYLDIDVTRLALTSGGSCFEGEGEEEDMSMRLCEKCSALAKLFEEIHEDFEAARLLLTECVRTFVGRMKKAAIKMSSGTDGDHLWRAEILKQCDLHLQKVPKEELDKISSDLFDSDSSIETLEGMSFEDQPATEYVSRDVEQITTTTPIPSSTVQNGDNRRKWSKEMTIESGVNQPVSKLDLEMDQILKTNEDLIRRLSDVVSRTKFPRQSTSVSSTTSTIQEVASPNVCLICGLTSSTPANIRNHVMVAHTTTFFSEQFPPGTSEGDVAHVVSKFCQTDVAWAGKGRVDCNLCGGVQRAHSRKSHLLHTHLNDIITTLKSEKGSSYRGTPKKQFPASSESSAERLRIQRLAAKFSGRAKLKCPICGQWCFSKQGLSTHTRNTHAKPTETISPSTNLGGLHKVTKPSKPANNPATRQASTTTTVANNRKLPTCRYCSATFVVPRNCYRHMLVRHPLQFWAGRLPPSTKQKDLDTAIEILEERHLSGSYRSKLNCGLCSRICGDSSRAFHLLDKHANEVFATLKSLMEE